MNLNRPDMTEAVQSSDYTKKFLQKDSNHTTMEVVTQTNAVKSPTDSPATTKLVYTVEEIARMLAISLRSAYRRHGNAETQALPHGKPLYDPEQNALRFVYRGQKAGTDRKAEAAIPFRHHDPRGSSAARNSVPVCRGMGYSCQKPCSCGQPQEVHAGAHHLDGGGNVSGSGQHGGPHPASGSPPHIGGRTAGGRDRRSDPGRS